MQGAAVELRNISKSFDGHRPLNLVFQHYALFPHMSVYKNVAFGLEMLKLPQTEIDQRVRQVLDLVHLSGLEKRYPKQLSGGQQQRAALARAIVTEPPVLLLDEPLGALDLKLRKAMQLELKSLQRRLGLTFLHVTHDQEEALAVSDRLAVMYAGRVLQIGTPEAIYEHPKSRFVADFIGEANLFEGEVKALAGAYARVAVNGVEFNACVRSEAVSAGSPVLLTLRPEKIALDRQPFAEVDNSFYGLSTLCRYREARFQPTRGRLRSRGESPPGLLARAFAPDLARRHYRLSFGIH
jgi:spermidine/putrescine transport system ATP-binding protein